MNNIITALKVQSSDKNNVNIFVNGQRAFVVSLDVAVKLRKGEVLNGSRIEALKREDERNRAYHSAIRCLGFRARSKIELEGYLTRKGYTSETVTKTVDRLIHEKYLDDRAFARIWIETRERSRPRSAYALRCELRQKGIADEIIENALVDFDDENAAWLSVTSRLPSWQRLNQKDLKKKVMGFLHRRGFDYEISLNAFNRTRSYLHSKSESEEQI
jgi:regulatory protein